MPGMQNPNLSQAQVQATPSQVQANPILIPITPSLILDSRIRIYHYHVAPADVLNINVWQHPEFDFLEKPAVLTGTNVGIQGAAGQPGYLVNSSGYINFPLLGYVRVAGKTMEEIRNDLRQKLRRYVTQPEINVRVADYRGQKVYVLGEVLKPGYLPITDQPLTIADALALTGGMNPESADPKYIYVIRGNVLEPKIYWLDAKTPDKMLLAERFSLHPKDILYVSSAPAARWNRVVKQLLPSVQTVWYTQAVVRNS